jgi:VIT1/CCC1 family predicted Fe2+/Mn2+ transporter
LRGELKAGRIGARLRLLAGGGQLGAGPVGEAVRAHPLEAFQRGAELVTGVAPVPLPAQPFPVDQARAGQCQIDPVGIRGAHLQGRADQHPDGLGGPALGFQEQALHPPGPGQRQRLRQVRDGLPGERGRTGATGAISAAVSMMAGTFLDIETANDQAASRIAEERARYAADPEKASQDVHRRLVSAGFSDTEAATVAGIMGKHPEIPLKIAAAVDLGAGEATRQNPYVQSAWMFITDLFAAAVPVVPFAIFGLGTARIVSLAVTFALPLILGVGRARIGRRPAGRQAHLLTPTWEG